MKCKGGDIKKDRGKRGGRERKVWTEKRRRGRRKERMLIYYFFFF